MTECLLFAQGGVLPSVNKCTIQRFQASQHVHKCDVLNLVLVVEQEKQLLSLCSISKHRSLLTKSQEGHITAWMDSHIL